MTLPAPEPPKVSAMELRADAVAGMTTAAVVVPQAMAYATIAGLPVQIGLYARLGFLADLISVPVLVGFKVGTGLVIAAGQLGKILGIDASGDNFFQQVGAALRHIGDVDPPTATLAGATISELVVVHKVAPRVPGPLLAVGLGIAAVWAFDLGNDGVALIAPVPQGLPRPELPALDGSAGLLAPAAAIALMAFVESSSAARSFRRPTDPPVVVDRELVALGAANVAGSAFGSMPAAGGLSQTAVNEGAGARSQTASLVTVAGVALTLTVLAPVFSDLAQATLGAVVIVAAAGLVDVGALRRLAAVRREELPIRPACCCSTGPNQPRHGSTLFAIHADLNEQLRQRGVALWVAGDLAAVQARPGGDDGIRHFASLSEALAGYGTPD